MPSVAPTRPPFEAPGVLADDDFTPVFELLFGLLADVVRRREPGLIKHLFETGRDQGRNQGRAGTIPDALRVPALQVTGIWFQLLGIAEENVAQRSRRHMESAGGPDQVAGSFSDVVGSVAAAGVSAEDLAAALASAEVSPTLTAHPTEAKRVTVLEIHRRIYRGLVALETDRWTPREREALIRALRTDIDLLWLTGELRLEKPTVEQEIAWGLHFFHETLYEQTPRVIDALAAALRRHYPEAAVPAPALLRFSTWIGGDRDGNPFVTADTTRFALTEYRRAAIRRLASGCTEMVALISISANAVNVPDAFRSALAGLLAASGQGAEIARRNPDEVFRQYFVAITERLKATDGQESAARPYANPDELVRDLLAAERALMMIGAEDLARTRLRPLRLEAEIFGFRTASLDIRQNSSVVNRTLSDIWAQLPPDGIETLPEVNSRDWHALVCRELARAELPAPDRAALTAEAAEMMATLDVVREAQGGPDPRGVGALILSMTTSAADLLAFYLLGRYAGLPDGEDGRRVVTVIPLLETIDDLGNARRS
ncbi:Phosphoenolpyruvate carboxylase [Methylobrevis pamukkalensis]|uniref:Phosphoenolpyruvate carboxylase n=1 Tax=Methylobrevis pamukkalensis TaxID=1439726 RepID=A0A1E3H750_9HYPH|nr:Phosphoenolpyruvate carboxylase [Methylobrevis pamukkalensis]